MKKILFLLIFFTLTQITYAGLTEEQQQAELQALQVQEETARQEYDAQKADLEKYLQEELSRLDAMEDQQKARNSKRLLFRKYNAKKKGITNEYQSTIRILRDETTRVKRGFNPDEWVEQMKFQQDAQRSETMKSLLDRKGAQDKLLKKDREAAKKKQKNKPKQKLVPNSKSKNVPKSSADLFKRNSSKTKSRYGGSRKGS